jgi:hypothetical protein
MWKSYGNLNTLPHQSTPTNRETNKKTKQDNFETQQEHATKSLKQNRWTVKQTTKSHIQVYPLTGVETKMWTCLLVYHLAVLHAHNSSSHIHFARAYLLRHVHHSHMCATHNLSRGTIEKRNDSEPPGAGIMENVMILSRQARELWKTYCFGSARRRNYGKRNVSEPPGTGTMENVMFLSRQARELWKTYCFELPQKKTS